MRELMQEASTRKIYDVHSSFYDATFGRLVRRRIAIAISHMNISQTDRVLDLEIDYRYKLENIDLGEAVVVTNNKSAVGPDAKPAAGIGTRSGRRKRLPVLAA